MACLWQPGFPTFPLSAANCGGWFDGSPRSELQPCQHCQRSFRPAALDKHVKVPWATLAPSNSFYETQRGCVQKLQNAKVLTPSCPTFTGLLPTSSSSWLGVSECVPFPWCQAQFPKQFGALVFSCEEFQIWGSKLVETCGEKESRHVWYSKPPGPPSDPLQVWPPPSVPSGRDHRNAKGHTSEVPFV